MNDTPIRIPLLRDRHTHPMLYSAFMEGLDLKHDTGATREQTLARIRAHARTGSGGWTIAHGWNSGRYALSKQDFDDLPPLVVFNLSLHGLIVNEAGRELLSRTSPQVAGHLDDQDWIDRNLRLVLNVFATDGASPERLHRFYRWLLGEHGVYYAEEMLLTDEREIVLFEAAGLAGRTRFWAAPEQYESLPEPVREKIYGIKLFTDGAIGTWTAALHRSYQGASAAGQLTYETGDLERMVARYTGEGRPMAIHAVGDRAIDQVVSAVETAGSSARSEVRIEHAQFISEPTARRAKALGIRLCMQPNFSDDSADYAARLPEGYPEQNNPFRMLIDEVGFVPGKDLLFGSDGMPHGVHEALRQSLFPPFSGQRLTLEEFVAGYCLPDENAGHIEVQIDPERRQVTCRIVTDPVQP